MKIYIRDKRNTHYRIATAPWTGLQFQFHTAPRMPILFLIILILYWSFHPVLGYAVKNSYYQNINEKNFQPYLNSQNTMPATAPPPPSPQELATLEGTYIDKKGNPIENADVTYSGSSDVTDEDGYFSMDVLITGQEEHKPTEPKEPLSQNYPNPFRGETTIETSVEEESNLRIFDVTGKLVDQIELDEPGNYELKWGGKDAVPGIYFLNLISGEQSHTKKIMYQGSGFGGLDITGYESLTPEDRLFMKSGSIDTLRFSKPNTTLIEYEFELLGDSTITEIGNPGPNEYNPIPNTQGNIGDTLSWPIFDHVYNDEETNDYEPLSSNTWVTNDTLFFEVTEQGTTPVQLNVKDKTDPDLETLVEFNVSTDNNPPELINNIPNQNSDEDNQLTMDMTQYFSDPEGDELAYTFYNMPNATHDSTVNDIAYLTPDPDWNGEMENIEVEASDGQYSTFSNEWDWTINPVNDAPYEVSVIPTQQCMQGDTAWILVRPPHADDIDSPVLTYEADDPSGNSTYTTQGDSVGIIPNTGFSGTISDIVINVDDGEYDIDLTPFDLNVVLSNNPPVQTNNIPDQVSDEDNTHWIYMLDYVNDPDGDPLSYVVDSLDHSDYWSSNDTLYLDPDPDWNGVEENVTITVSDGIDQLVLNAFDWTVNPINDAPYTTNPFSNYVIDEDNTLAIALRPDKFEDIDTPTLSYIANNLPFATYSVSNDTMYITPDEDWNGLMTGVNVTADDGEYQVTGNNFSITVNPVPDLPEQIQNIPTQNSDEDNTHVMNMLTYVYNPDGDQMSYVVLHQQNSTYSTNQDDVSLIPNDNWYGTESGLEIEVTNNAGTITLNPFDWEVASVNDVPQVNPDSESTNQGQSVTIDVIANDTDNLDPNGAIDASSVSITAAPSNGTTSVDPVTGEVTYTPDPGFYGTDQFTYEAGDNGTPQLFDDAVVSITVNQLDEVYFKVMDIMQDTALNGATLTIGSNNYVLSQGDTSIAVTPGTYEVNATHPNTIDWTSIWEEYTAIQRPGQDANVEQRAKDDYSSQVTFDGNADTLYIYKVMDDFNMATVTGIIGSGPNGETHRFSDNDLDAPAWVNLNYTAPNSTTETRMQYWIAQLIPATKGKLNMVYQQGTTTPSVPYLEMAIDPSFGPSNGTVAPNNTIDSCYAHWPNNFQSKYVIGIEMLQAVGDLNDIGGVDPPILSFENGDWVINHTGQECFKVLYNFDPGTKF